MCTGQPGSDERKREIAKRVKAHRLRFDGFRTCLHCDVEPKLAYSFSRGQEEFVFYCPVCGYYSTAGLTLQSAITLWSISNIKEAFKWDIWQRRYQQQIEELSCEQKKKRNAFRLRKPSFAS